MRQATEQGKRLAGFTPEVIDWMLQHDWPGNVRELENAVERGAVLCRGEEIDIPDLLLRPAPSTSRDEPPGLQDALDAATVRAVRAALEGAQGVRTEAASTLGVDRTTLYRLMKRFEIE